MFFKNALGYKLKDDFNFTQLMLDQIEVFQKFSECLDQQPVSMGFVPVVPSSESLYLHLPEQDRYLFCLRVQQRLLPASVVREALQEKVELIRFNEDRTVGSKERTSLKDEIIFSLLPKAFKKTTNHFFFVDMKTKMMVVNESSGAMADNVTAFFRQSLGSLPVSLISYSMGVSEILTGWVKDEESIPENWGIGGDELDLTFENMASSKITAKNMQLDLATIGALDNNYVVTKSFFDFKGRLYGNIDKNCHIKSIKYADFIVEQALDQSDDDYQSQLIASFQIMSDELIELLTACQGVFSNGAE